MAQKKAYSRYFIILQQDENGYSLASDKLPSGYTKLETKNDKCKISYYVQNLKKEKEPYYMALICNKRDSKKVINLGMMNIDDYGRAEITHECNVDNIAGSNVPVDMVTGAAIIKLIDTSIVSVMSGFSTTDVPADWRGYSVIDVNREKDSSAEKVSEHTVVKEEAKKEIVKVEEVKVEVKREEKNIFEEYEKKIEEAKVFEKIEETRVEEKSELNEQNVDAASSGIELEIETQVETQENLRTEESDKDNLGGEEPVHENINSDLGDQRHKHKNKCKCEHPSGTVGDFFKVLAEEFEEVEEVCIEIKRCRWYKISVKNLDELCNQTNYNKYTLVYYPMISYYPYIRKYGHYLLGYKYDASGKMKYLVYGIPGMKSKVEQPYGGKSGFVTWVPEKPGEEKDEDMGYWLMFYDFRTSTIVIPMK